MVLCLSAVILSGCQANSEPRARVTVTATPSSQPSASLQPSAPKVDPPPADVASALGGKVSFISTMPTSNELADTMRGLWTIDAATYSGPGSDARGRPMLERQLALLVQPKRCRPTGLAALLGITAKPSYESVEQAAARPDRGSLTMEVQKFRTVAEATSALQRWKSGFAACPTFQADLGSGTRLVTIDELRAGRSRLAATVRLVRGAGGVYITWRAERVGSALVRVSGLWSRSQDGVQMDSPIGSTEVKAVVALVTRRIAASESAANSM